jgi:hypothetical protein
VEVSDFPLGLTLAMLGTKLCRGGRVKLGGVNQEPGVDRSTEGEDPGKLFDGAHSRNNDLVAVAENRAKETADRAEHTVGRGPG